MCASQVSTLNIQINSPQKGERHMIMEDDIGFESIFSWEALRCSSKTATVTIIVIIYHRPEESRENLHMKDFQTIFFS